MTLVSISSCINGEKMKVLKLCSLLVSACLAISLSSLASAAPITYEYTGNKFTVIEGSVPSVTTDDRLTGFVTFATAPTAGQSGKNDFTAFSLTDGATTYSSDTSGFIDPGSFFSFDDSLNVVSWRLDVYPSGALDNGDGLTTANYTFVFDLSRIGAGDIQNAFINEQPGVWTTVGSVPEPATLALIFLGLVGAGFSRRKGLTAACEQQVT